MDLAGHIQALYDHFRDVRFPFEDGLKTIDELRDADSCFISSFARHIENTPLGRLFVLAARESVTRYLRDVTADFRETLEHYLYFVSYLRIDDVPPEIRQNGIIDRILWEDVDKKNEDALSQSYCSPTRGVLFKVFREGSDERGGIYRVTVFACPDKMYLVWGKEMTFLDTLRLEMMKGWQCITPDEVIFVP